MFGSIEFGGTKHLTRVNIYNCELCRPERLLAIVNQIIGYFSIYSNPIIRISKFSHYLSFVIFQTVEKYHFNRQKL